MANKKINKDYSDLNNRYSDARVNGYRHHHYFLKEQQFLLSEIGKKPCDLLDLASGSGLMSMPLVSCQFNVFALDYNVTACDKARKNQLLVIRGDAYAIPVKDSCMDVIINCQFFNQQEASAAMLFFQETYRVLRKGGRLFLIWRNGDAFIHKLAHGLFSIYDRIVERPDFPVYNHQIKTFMQLAQKAGFRVKKCETILPLLNWRTKNHGGIASRLIGASNYMLLVK